MEHENQFDTKEMNPVGRPDAQPEQAGGAETGQPQSEKTARPEDAQPAEGQLEQNAQEAGPQSSEQGAQQPQVGEVGQMAAQEIPADPEQGAFTGDGFILGEDFVVDESAALEGETETPADEPEKGKHKKRKKRKGCLGAGIWIAVIVALSVALAATVIVFGSDYLGIGPGRGDEVVVEISQGMTTKEIAGKLKEVNAINSEWMFRLYTKLKGYDGTYKYGVYTFNNENGYEELAKMLQTDGAKAETVEVTIKEMSTIDDMKELLEEKGVCTASAFVRAVQNASFNFDFVEEIPDNEVYYRLEGYLFPDTYQFYSYDDEKCAELAVQKMLETMDQKWTDEMRARAKEMGYTMHEILTMASIVELEAGGSPDEMANVAAVFYNRLSWDEPKMLGSSPTAEYPHGGGRYDTNINEGLPPGPLCAPSLNSIMAALYPTEDFDYTYFVTDKNMKFY